MAISQESTATVEQESKQPNIEQHHGFIEQVGWKALFGFTTKKHIPVLCAAAFFGCIAAITLPTMSILFGLIFRQFADFASGSISGVTLLNKASKYCIYLTGVCALNWITNCFYFASFLTFGELQAWSAREQIFTALLRKDIKWYDTRENGIAAFLPALQMQTRDLQLSNSAPLGEAVQCSAMGLTALGVAFYFSWNLTLVIICTVPIVYLIMGFLSGQLSKRAHEQADQLQQALKFVTTAVQYIETVKSFNGERFELQKYVRAIGRAAGLYKRQAHLRSVQIGFMQFVTISLFFQGFWYGSHLVTSGKKNAAQIVTTFWAALQAVQAISEFLPQLIVLQKGKVAGARLRAVMAQISKYDENLDAIGDIRPKRCSGDVELSNVSFFYPTLPHQLALINASLFFAAGETTFVVGRSGCGKSTLGKLLVRFYNPICGDISIDGISLKDLDVHWLRENVTLVEQDSVLFNDSIFRNIAMARKDMKVTKNEVNEAATFASLESMIQELPDGLDTMVASKGDSMSGGQKQRVALARARLRDTPILILDESTSALDYITRSTINEAIRTWRRGKTTIIITHDIKQILPNDFVYILHKARVVQEGYRKDMETNQRSAFHTFLTSDIGGDDGREDSIKGTNDDDTDEILSLYAAAWTLQPRVVNELLFEEAFTSPFLTSGHRRSMYRTSVTPEGRPSTSRSDAHRSSIAILDDGEDEFGSRHSSLVPVKAPPFSASFGVPKQIGYRIQPHSVPGSSGHASPHSSYPVSLLSSRPVSMAEDVPVHLDTRDLPRHQTKFSLRRSRQRRVYEEPQESTKRAPSLGILQILRTFWPGLDWRSRLLLVGAINCALVHAGATPVFGFVFARLLSTFYATSDQSQHARRYALIILGISIGDGLATYGFQFLFDSCAQTWANHLKAEAMRRILLQPREFFDRDENSVSRLAECLDNFGEEARNLPGRFVGISTVVIFMISIAVMWSLVACWKLTLVALGTGPILYAIMTCYNTISSRWETRSNEVDEHLGQVLYETFVNIRTVRCLVLEDVFRDKFKKTTTDAFKVGLKRAIYTGSIFGINFSAVYFVATLCFWFGAYIVSTKEFATTNIIQVFTILLLSMNHVSYIVNYIPQINIARDAGSRLIRLAQLPTDSHELKGTAQVNQLGDITFKDLNFSYPVRKDHPVLHGISFRILSGSCTAIVGSSGSGKSTIAALLLRLYQTNGLPSSDLTISRHNIKSLHTTKLRSRMAIVSQTPVLFPGTVAENIAYGLSPSSSHASPQRIRAAASAAGISEFIESLPQGYGTLIGEGGSGLSGGQAQRIAIARALVRDPDVLILDEATSALDVESARIIRDTIHKLVTSSRGSQQGAWCDDTRRTGKTAERGGMTVIIITHAREMMAIAEHIVMLDKGRVVEQGRFEELKRRRGPFSRLLRGEAELLTRGGPYS